MRRKVEKTKSFGFCAAVAMAFMAISFFAAGALARTYTTDADFDEGVLVGVEHETVHDQLQLSKTPVILPFIWVPNNNGTVSKVQTETGNELGRYQVAPHSDCSPSRTTVDLQGSCYVGNRQAGTVVKIGLYEAGIWIDRNGDGVCQTSQDLDHDGKIKGLEILPWGEDECVLYEVVLIPGKEGTFAPGTYMGGYDYDYWGTAPRGLAVDAKNNLWAGTWATSKYYYIDGSTGAILNTVDVSLWGHHAYGAVIDKNGILWSAQLSSHVLRINTSNLSDIIRVDVSHTYGLGLDYLGHLFVGGGGQLTKINTSDPVSPIMWTKGALTVRGVVCTADNDVWVAGYDQYWNYNAVSRYDNNGNYKAGIYVGNAPSGVAVDAAGKVWSCNIGDEYITRIDPTTNNLDLAKLIVGSGGHYTYSDMTGIISRTITTKLGTWTVVHDSGEADTEWGKISWNSNEPQGTSIKVKVSSSDDQISWSPWETAINCVPLSATPDGRFLKVEATLQIISGEVSPILYDLTVLPANQPPDCSGAVPSIKEIWPPDHKWVEIRILGVTDPDWDPVTIIVTGITSDEPTASDKGSGGPQHAPDAKGVGTDTAWLRAERSGNGNGRVYEISFEADDGKGGLCGGTVQVCVPHDQKPECECIDDGQNYDATQIN
jgi:streptogramin lyase